MTAVTWSDMQNSKEVTKNNIVKLLLKKIGSDKQSMMR